MKLAKAALVFTVASAAWARGQCGEQKPEASLPFTMSTVATFNLPWRLAFLPDGRMLITEKVGPVWLVTQQGERSRSRIRPRSFTRARTACTPSTSRPSTPPTRASISLTPSPGEYGGGLALARRPAGRDRHLREARKSPGAVAPDAQGARAARKAQRSRSRRTVSTCSSRWADRQRFFPRGRIRTSPRARSCV